MKVRNLTYKDKLTPPHWNIPGQRPNPTTTLVAIEDGKVCGISWMAYGGPVGMILMWFSADPRATFPLYRASLRLAREFKCAMLLSHVQEGSRLLHLMERRGWAVNSWKSIAVGRPVDNGVFRTQRRVLKGGAA